MKKIFLFVFFAASVSCASGGTLKSLNSEKFPVKLPELGYKTDSLVAAVDKETMEIHHGKHHKAYVDNANKALPNEKSTVLDIFKIYQNNQMQFVIMLVATGITRFFGWY